MAQINTEWDYGLKEEVFKVTGDKGYVHKTNTTLKRTSTAINRTLFDYCTVEFKVNVDKDIGTSYIIFYDNGKAIPFYINGTKYSQYEWTQNTTEKTVVLRLGYDIDHNIRVKYRGNSNGLPSKSKVITLSAEDDVPRPNTFSSTIARTNNTVQFNEGSSVSLPISYTSGGNAQSNHTKSIKVYCDGTLKTTLTASMTTGSANATISTQASLTSLTKGKHHIDFVFEGDSYNAYADLSFDIKVGYDIKIISKPETTVDCSDNTYQDHNSIVVQVKNFDDSPVTSASVTVHNNGSTSTKTTDSKGQITYVANSGATNFKVVYSSSESEQITIPHLIITQAEVTTDNEYISTNSNNVVQTEITEYSWKDDNEGSLADIPVFVEDSDGNTYEGTLNEDGIATVDYHTDTEEEEVEFTVTTGDTGGTATLKQVWQYWNANNKSAELNKKCLMLWHGMWTELANGYKFSPDATLFCRIGFGTGATEIGDYEITFRNIKEQKNVIMRGGGWRNHKGEVTFNRPTYTQKMYFAPNNTYTVKRVGSQLRVLRGGDVLFTSQVTTNGEPFIELVFEKKSDFVIWNEITIKEL